MLKRMKVRGIMKKNQIVLTALAVIVVVAGYITLIGNDPVSDASSTDGSQENILGDLNQSLSEEDIIAENNERLDALNNSVNDGTGDINGSYEDNSKPGEAILTSGITVSNFIAEQKLNREQTRSANKETLLSVIENEEVSDEEKQAAIDTMTKLTDIAERENAAETLLSAKGFTDAIVSISDTGVDVILCRNSLTEAEKAQVEDIIKRKTNMSVEQLVISLMKVQETTATDASSENETQNSTEGSK